MARVYVFTCGDEETETIVVVGRAKVVIVDSIEKAREYLVKSKCRIVDLVWDGESHLCVE
mgnify:FL=1